MTTAAPEAAHDLRTYDDDDFCHVLVRSGRGVCGAKEACSAVARGAPLRVGMRCSGCGRPVCPDCIGQINSEI